MTLFELNIIPIQALELNTVYSDQLQFIFIEDEGQKLSIAMGKYHINNQY